MTTVRDTRCEAKIALRKGGDGQCARRAIFTLKLRGLEIGLCTQHEAAMAKRSVGRRYSVPL